MARTLSIRETRAALARIDDVLAAAGEIVVTRRGRPVARLLPVAARRDVPSHEALRASLPLLAAGSETLVRRDRDER